MQYQDQDHGSGNNIMTIASQQVTVSSTGAVALNAVSNKVLHLALRNVDTVILEYVGAAGVTSTTGFALPGTTAAPYAVLYISVPPGEIVYARAASGSPAMHVLSDDSPTNALNSVGYVVT